MIDRKARDAEIEIDDAFLRHPLLQLRYDSALFVTLVAANEILDTFRGAPRHTTAVAIDTIINALKHATFWLWSRRNETRAKPKATREDTENAKSFIGLAIEYAGMSAAYTYGWKGLLNISTDGQTLRVSGELLKDTRYEAYNYLLTPSLISSRSPPTISDAGFIEEIRKAKQRNLEFLNFPTDRAVVTAAYHLIAKHSESFYTLPRKWQFDAFSLTAFRAVHDILGSIVYTWNRIAAVLEVASDQLPYGASLPFVISKHALLETISDVTGMAKSDIRPIINILEYGSGGLADPDPVLQPLIPQTSGHYLLSQPLILGSAAERNLAVLLNRLPKEKKAYARLTNEKEASMRDRIIRRLPPEIEAWNGTLSKREKLGNVDLALIDRRDGVLLLLELKWFVDPAEVNEIIHRSEELAKGVTQCKRVVAAAWESPQLLDVVPGGPFVDFMAVVVSANWIGFADVQDSGVPIINEEHLIRKLGVPSSLADVIAWLRARQYLPLEGGDYQLRSRPTKVDRWQLDWYRIEALIENFMPL